MNIIKHTHTKPFLSEALEIFQIPKDGNEENVKLEFMKQFPGEFFKTYEYQIVNIAGKFVIVHVHPRAKTPFVDDYALRSLMDQKLVMLIGNTVNSIIAGYFLSGICVGEYEYRTGDFGEKSIRAILVDIEKLMQKQRMLFASYKLPEEIFVKNSTHEFNLILKKYFTNMQNPKIIKIV